MTTAPFDIDAYLARRLHFETAFTPRDVMLYQLGLGFGRDPMDEAELPFVYEKSLVVMPSYATILAFGRRLITAKDDLDLVKLLHGEQALELHRPIPASGTVVGEVRITDIIDKGAEKGCIIVQEIGLSLKESGDRLATLRGSGFYRGDGGRGGTSGPAAVPHVIPDRAADAVVAIATRPDQALLYRLSGDYNPLHAEPAFARAAGFRQPILHGLCSYGIACRAVVQAFVPGAPERVAAFDVRFSSPVYPGETIVTQLWRDGDTVSYRCKVQERDVVVLNNGRAMLG